MIASLYANTADPWPLTEGVVHVWRFDVAGEANAAELADDERAVAERFASRALRDA